MLRSGPKGGNGNGRTYVAGTRTTWKPVAAAATASLPTAQPAAVALPLVGSPMTVSITWKLRGEQDGSGPTRPSGVRAYSSVMKLAADSPWPGSIPDSTMLTGNVEFRNGGITARLRFVGRKVETQAMSLNMMGGIAEPAETGAHGGSDARWRKAKMVGFTTSKTLLLLQLVKLQSPDGDTGAHELDVGSGP